MSVLYYCTTIYVYGDTVGHNKVYHRLDYMELNLSAEERFTYEVPRMCSFTKPEKPCYQMISDK